MKYKLRFYYPPNHPKKGDFHHEEQFPTLEMLDARYRAVFVREYGSYNPTAWRYVEYEKIGPFIVQNEYVRIPNY